MSIFEKDFITLAENGALSRSQLFYGRAPNATRELLLRLASRFEKKADQSSLTDARVFESGGELSIETLRESMRFLSLTPQVSRYRLAILFAPDGMSDQTPDALLKFAEEPPPHACIFLITRDLERLPTTLLSRFEKRFVPGNEAGASEKGKQYSEALLSSSGSERRDIIKAIIEDGATRETLESIILTLRKNILTRPRVLRECSRRLRLLTDRNVNPRMQLEAALASL